ncbi:MAG: sulfatase-like hydrolase/transferase [Planctomycetota bacterium]
MGAAIAFGVWYVSAPATAQAPAAPNVLIIVADDAERRDLGSYGGRLATPNLDRLAAEGARFTRAYPTSTVCTPSRYTLLTGRIPSRSATVAQRTPAGEPARITWNTFINPDDATLADAFSANGFATALVGKWHVGLGPQWHVPPRSWPDDPDYARPMEENIELRARHIRELGGFDHARAVYPNNVKAMPVSSRLMGHHQHWLTHETLRQFDDFALGDRPWLLYHATTIPHPPDIWDTLHDMDPRATLHGYRDEHLDVLPDFADLIRRTEAYGPFENRSVRSETAGVLWLDDAVGAMLDDLEARGLLDRTIVVFVSDHGRRGKFVLNDGPVPLLIRWPEKIEPGTVVDGVVSLADLLPSLIDLAGGTLPADYPTDGVSFVPLLTGEAEQVRAAAYMEVTYTRGVVTAGFKYIATRFPERIAETLTPDNRRRINPEGAGESFGDPDGGRVRYNKHRIFPGYFDDDQLYDLRADPGEQHNLAADPAHAAALAEMKSHLHRFSADLPHPFGEFGIDPLETGE